VKRWFSDPMFHRVLRLALIVAVLGVAGWIVTGRPGALRDGMSAADGVIVGAAAMRLWTWKEHGEDTSEEHEHE
jgi:hypothetical protein